MPDTYHTIAKAIRYFVDHQRQQPSLVDVANHVHLSEFHLQRLFSEWAGVSPKQFLQYLTKENAKQHLKQMNVLDASLASGLSGSGRLHDLMVACEGMTPGEYRQLGEGTHIQYGQGHCLFGSFFLAATERGICKLSFYDNQDEVAQLEAELKATWPNARIQQNDEVIASFARQVFPSIEQGRSPERKPLRVVLKGSPFQLKVWEALLNIPEGAVCTYQDVADQIGSPKAVRAVASAIARNEIGYLIPCHRVIRGTGEFSQYRWGVDRKPVMIGWELSRVNDSNAC